MASGELLPRGLGKMQMQEERRGWSRASCPGVGRQPASCSLSRPSVRQDHTVLGLIVSEATSRLSPPSAAAAAANSFSITNPRPCTAQGTFHSPPYTGNRVQQPLCPRRCSKNHELNMGLKPSWLGLDSEGKRLLQPFARESAGSLQVSALCLPPTESESQRVGPGNSVLNKLPRRA